MLEKEEAKEYYIQMIEDYCNVTFDRNNLPAGVKLALEQYMKVDPQQLMIGSQKLHDMSITYQDPAGFQRRIKSFISPYIRPHLVGDKGRREYINGR